MYVTKARKWLGCKFQLTCKFLIKVLFFKLNCFNVAFPLRQRNFSVQKARKRRPSFRFSVALLNKHSIKLYTTSCDVSWWGVAASFDTTLIYTVRQIYNATDFILTTIEMPSMMQCMPSMCPNFICNLATPQRPTLSMMGNTAPCCAGSERTWSQQRHGAENKH